MLLWWVFIAPRSLIVHTGDPDIDTAPILSWSKKMGFTSMNAGAFGRFLLRHQSMLYFPVLFFARISWLIQSALYVMGVRSHPWGDTYTPDTLQYPVMERVSLALYYVWYIGLMYVALLGLAADTGPPPNVIHL